MHEWEQECRWRGPGGGTDNVLGTNGSSLPWWPGHPARKLPGASFPLAGRWGGVGSRSSIARVSCAALIRRNWLEQCVHTQTKVAGQRFPGDQGMMSCTQLSSRGWWLLPTAGLGLGTRSSEVPRARQGTAGGIGAMGVQKERNQESSP